MNKKKRFEISNQPTIPTPPALLARFLHVMKNSVIGIPVDFGPTEFGTIRMIYNEPCPIQWLQDTVFAYDRTLSEWITLIKEHKYAKEPEKKGIPCPFTMRKMAGEYYEHMFTKNQQLRRTLHKFLIRVRIRIMDKRIVGAEDLVTTVAIPKKDLVSVYDIKARNKYLFHTNTIARMMSSSLQYSSWGIPNPKPPTNPYTNVPWSYTQCMSITSQIIRNQAQYHRAPAYNLLGFRSCNYNMTTFAYRYRNHLRIQAATSLFKDNTSAEAQEIYDEIIDFMFEDVPNTQRVPLRLLKHRGFPATITKQWDDLVIAYFLQRNHGICVVPYRTILDMDRAFHSLSKQTYAYWIANMRAIVKRPRDAEGELGRLPTALETATAAVTAAVDAAAAVVAAAAVAQNAVNDAVNEITVD